MYLTKGASRALIDAFSAHNRGKDERSTSPNQLGLADFLFEKHSVNNQKND